jgi:hypothetical protein
MRIGLKLLVVTVILTFSFVSSDWIDAQSAEETVQNQMQHANAFYWLGMVEKGNIDAFHQGIEHLKQAASLLNSASLPPAEKEKLDQAIRALRTDLNNQIYIHQNHFYAVFPLARLLTPSFFVHSQAASTFEMMRDPQEKAVSLAGEALRDEVVERWAARPQLDVVITSIPPNKALENNLSFIFSSSSRFSVHNYWEVAKVLPAKELAAYRDGMITPEIQRKLCEAFSIPDILLVSVSKLDKVDKNFFYLLKGRIYNLAQDETTHTFSKKGMARDRRGQLQPIIITCISLLLIAIVVYFLVVKLRTKKWPSSTSTLPVPILGFAIGLLMPYVLMPMLTAISPAPDELATISFWWPCLVGVTLFLGPVIFYRIASARLNAFTSAIDMTCQGGALCVTIALGVCAYLTGPLFLYLQKEAYQAIFPLSLCSSMALYLIGWFLESDSPVLFFAAIVSSIAIALLGAALLHIGIVYLWIITGTVLVMGLAVLIAAKEVFGGRCRELSAGPKVPENIDDLVSCSEAPSYQEFEFYKKVFDSLKPFVDGKTVWLQLT